MNARVGELVGTIREVGRTTTTDEDDPKRQIRLLMTSEEQARGVVPVPKTREYVVLEGDVKGLDAYL